MSDLGQILTQQAVIERDEGSADAYGGETAPDWQPLATLACRFWWWKQGYRGPAHEAVAPERTASIGDGGLAIAPGADVSADDRLANVLDRHGNVVEAGPFAIVAVQAQETHIEIFVRRP